MTPNSPAITIFFKQENLKNITSWIDRHMILLTTIILSVVAIFFFFFFYNQGLGLAYNDARSHLDIGRRVVEGLKPGLAQIGSVWLPLPHLLMIPTIWNDFMWHSGLSGALQSMVSYVLTGVLIIMFLRRLKVGLFGQFVGLLVFATNLNILYLQSTAMTELLLIATMFASVYELLRWHENENIIHLVKAAFWVMLSTLIRYDGWFLCFQVFVLIAIHTWRKYGWKKTEGMSILYCTLAGLGIVLWVVWNWMIFKDPLYFAVGPYSAHAQQEQIEAAGLLQTKKNIPLSFAVYSLATLYNVGTIPMLIGILGAIALWFVVLQDVF